MSPARLRVSAEEHICRAVQEQEIDIIPGIVFQRLEAFQCGRDAEVPVSDVNADGKRAVWLIVKHALERHGATLEIRSTPGEGSEFICHFPTSRLAMADAVPITRDSAAG